MSLVFGKYEKIRRIAQGGMGEVFLARQTGVLDRLAILKQLRPDLASEMSRVLAARAAELRAKTEAAAHAPQEGEHDDILERVRRFFGLED